MTSRTDVLLFAEDPSAANYAALLLPELAPRGLLTLLYAANVAAELLRSRGIDFVPAGPASDAQALLDQIRPGCVLTGTAENPDTLGLQLITAARGMGIPSIATVDARMHAEHRFRGRTADPLAHAPDWLLVPDQWTLDAFAGLGFPEQRISVCGYPQYDLVLGLTEQWQPIGSAAFRKRLFPEVDSGRKILVFISEGALRYDLLPKRAGGEYNFKGRGIDKGRTKIVLEEVLDAIAVQDPRPYLVLRTHPIEAEGDYAEYADEIDAFSSGGSALELIYASDAVLGMTSMLLLEAALLGKPSLAILPHESEREWLPGTETGFISCASSRQQLKLALTTLLLDDSSLLATTRMAEIIPSGAVQRSANFIAARLQPRQ